MKNLFHIFAYLIIIVCFFPAFLSANFVSLDMAYKTANTHLQAQIARIENSKPSTTKETQKQFSIASLEPLRNPCNEQIIAYIANLNPVGYIAISVNTAIRPIIAYSYTNDFIMSDFRENSILHILSWDMINRLSNIRFASDETIRRNCNMWRVYIESAPSLIRTLATTTIHGPWLDTQWDQGTPYNNLCPIDPETGDRCVVGCTATSMAQIINYWEYPTAVSFVTDESYWSDSTSPAIWIDATTATIDTIDYNSGTGFHPNGDMKAALSWAVGVSIFAIYSSTGTIAWFHDSVFTDKWGYESALKVDPPEMDDFYARLANNMIAGMPAQLGIFNYEPDTGGHAIVCDGYMETGEFHLNYGWSGIMDAWYFLPDEMPYFEIMRWAIIDIFPPERADAPDIPESAMEIIVIDEERYLPDAISSPMDEDWFSFHAGPESTYIFTDASPINTCAEIYSPSADSIVLHDDDSGDDMNFMLCFLPDSAGIYYLKIHGSSEPNIGIYTLSYMRSAAPYIDITSPDGGENIDENSMHIIRWTKGGVPQIDCAKIEYSLSSTEGPWNVITDSTTNPNSFFWMVPEVDSNETDCYIKIGSVDYSRIFDISDAPFTIIDIDGVKEPEELPETDLLYVFPNPFNSSCRITTNGNTEVEIFDLQGKQIYINDLVAKLSLRTQKCTGTVPSQSGTHTFIWQPDETLSPGIYFIRVRTKEGRTISKRVVYLP